MEVKVAHMELNMVVNMEVDMVADTEVDMVADVKVDMVADMEVVCGLWFKTLFSYFDLKVQDSISYRN